MSPADGSDPRTSIPAAGDAFKERVGSAPQPAPDHLRYGLWTAGQLLSAGSTARAFKRVLIFTTDPNPAGTGPKAQDSRWGPAAVCSPHLQEVLSPH